MKIYFAGSITGGRGDQELYQVIVNELKKYGEVLTEHVANINISSSGEILEKSFIYKRDIDWLKESDLVVAEVTTVSLGVGYEIGFAESLNKKIICIYRSLPNKSLSAMIQGNPNLEVFKYESMSDLVTFFEKTIK